MLSAGAWKLSQQNLITFVLVDSNGNEVTGLGAGFTLQISKAGGAFAASAGTKAEISDGWYSYVSTQNEADTAGEVSIKITGAGIIQQNLSYVVETRAINAIAFTYTLTSDAAPFDPIEGAQVWIATDIAGLNVIWAGVTDGLGVARDSNGSLPFLDPGVYQFFRQRSGFLFQNPDQETVS